LRISRAALRKLVKEIKSLGLGKWEGKQHIVSSEEEDTPSESEDLVEMYRLWRMAWSWPANTSVFGTNELGRHSWEDSDGDE
jgi:hypothetical protein